MKKHLFIFTIVMLACAILLCGCISLGPVPQLAADNSLSSVPDEYTVKAGGRFAIALESNPTTGYTWQHVIGDTAILRYESLSFAAEDEEATGSGGVETFFFTGAKKGQTTLTLTYARDWEGGETEETKTIIVTVE